MKFKLSISGFLCNVKVNSMLFERLALSKDTKAVMKMVRKGQIIRKPEDAIKDPYILEFLNLKEETSYTESQLEEARTDKLQYFLLELGKGFRGEINGN